MNFFKAPTVAHPAESAVELGQLRTRDSYNLDAHSVLHFHNREGNGSLKLYQFCPELGNGGLYLTSPASGCRRAGAAPSACCMISLEVKPLCARVNMLQMVTWALYANLCSQNNIHSANKNYLE
ncbi:uncharacterized protein ACIB01_001121 [Guaruba guarouba]